MLHELLIMNPTKLTIGLLNYITIFIGFWCLRKLYKIWIYKSDTRIAMHEHYRLRGIGAGHNVGWPQCQDGQCGDMKRAEIAASA